MQDQNNSELKTKQYLHRHFGFGLRFNTMKQQSAFLMIQQNKMK